jgi:hypothetical protein
VRPAADHSAPDVTFVARSTRGAIVHWPHRKSSPNQATTSDTRARFGHSACSASSDAITSAPACSWCRFSGRVTPKPKACVTVDGS